MLFIFHRANSTDVKSSLKIPNLVHFYTCKFPWSLFLSFIPLRCLFSTLPLLHFLSSLTCAMIVFLFPITTTLFVSYKKRVLHASANPFIFCGAELAVCHMCSFLHWFTDNNEWSFHPNECNLLCSVDRYYSLTPSSLQTGAAVKTAKYMCILS